MINLPVRCRVFPSKTGPLTAGALTWLAVLAGVQLAGCRQETAPPKPVRNPSATAAIAFRQLATPWPESVAYQNGEEAGLKAILESLGGGVGVLDFDRDGRADLWFPQGGRLSSHSIEGLPSRLLRRVGEGYRDVGQPAAIALPKHYSHGCAIADFNNDGFADILVTGYGGLTLWRNLGDGTFEDITRFARLSDQLWSSSAAWGDLNGDGGLDLYVAHYVDWSLENNPPCLGEGGKPDVCPPRQFNDLSDVVYLSKQDGTFENATASCGLVEGGKGLGVILADIDHDGDTDGYVANDTTNNFLYINDGSGRLEETGILSGTAVDDLANANGSMGIAVTDFDNDGHSDLWVANYEDEVFALYRGLGNGSFLHVSTQTGIRALGTLLVGFGSVTGDFDLDGDEDFASANGHVIHHPRNAPLMQKPLVLENLDGKQFRRLEPPNGNYLAKSWAGRGLVTLDHNGDGLLDLLFVNTLQPPALIVNESNTSGRALTFQLVGTRANRNAIGAHVTIHLKGGQLLTRSMYGGGSYLSQSQPILHFGIPSGATIETIEVAWPGGAVNVLTTDDFENGDVDDRINLLIEPSSAKRPVGIFRLSATR